MTNRWNPPGEPTLYVAGDRGVAIAEFARHIREDNVPALAPRTIERRIFDLRVRVEATLDLRDPRVWTTLSLVDAPGCFLDRTVARATAGYLRHTTRTQALIVPSMALLDAPSRWVAVLFLDKLPADPAAFLADVRPDGTFRLDQ